MSLQRLLYNVVNARNSPRSPPRGGLRAHRPDNGVSTARGMHTAMKSKILAATGVVAVAAAALTGCSAGEAEASCTNEIQKPDATQVSVWAWYPAFQDVVDLFNNSHTDVQICWTNAGQGNDEYTKFSTAGEAGKGAPDVVMLEDEVLASFAVRKALVDLTKFGANDVKADYTDG